MFEDFENLKGTHEVRFEELFNDKFISKNTNSQTIEEFFKRSDFKIESESDFDSIDPEELNQFIKINSDFESWEEMFGAASDDWAFKQLGF